MSGLLKPADLQRYDGLRTKEHLGDGGQGGHTIRVYGTDTSRTKCYSFNSLGFRGEEPMESARLHIFACGCSYTFGEGLDLQETWCQKLKTIAAKNMKCNVADVNVLNFSQAGASNCYISRILLSQTSTFRPDLVVALFTLRERYELYGPDRAAPVHVHASRLDQYKGTEWEHRVEHSWLSLSDDDIAMRYIKNILLLQCHCKAAGIPFVFGSIEAMLDETFFDRIRTPLNRTLLNAVDFRKLVQLARSMIVDRAADGRHPGPESQELFARAFWARASEALGHDGGERRRA
jgi:hypothetical protein